MSQYILRDLPPALWSQVQARAQLEGWPLRALFLQLLEDFASGRHTPEKTSPLSSYAWMKPYFRELVLKDPSFLTLGEPAKWMRLQHYATTSGALNEATVKIFGQLDFGKRSAILKWLEASLVLQVDSNSSSMGLPAQTPRRMAIVKLHDGDRSVQIPDAATADEGPSHLALYDPAHRPVARFAWTDIKSWYFADESPP